MVKGGKNNKFTLKCKLPPQYAYKLIIWTFNILWQDQANQVNKSPETI